MRFIFYILLFILPIALQAQKDKLPKNGRATLYYPAANKKKQIKASGENQNSLKVGEWQFFTSDGSLDYTQEFVQGQEQGKKKYYINNILIANENYSNAILDGEQTYYGVDGSLLNTYYYSKGRIDSVYVYDPTLKKVTEINTFYENKKLKKWTVYFPTGEIKGLMTYDEEGKIHGTSLKYAKLYSTQKVYLSEKANYKHGILNGEYLLISDGVLRSKKEFKDGELNGTCYEFYSGANLKSEEEYVNGHLKGKCIYYSEYGGITDEAYYSGKLVGRNFDLADSSFTYYGNSRLQSKTYATFLPNSNLEIRSFEYYEKGQVLSKVIRLNGELDGIQTSYYENGQLKSQVDYRQGLMHGKANYWYKNGKKKLELLLEKNRVIKQTAWDEKGLLVPINKPAYQTIYFSEIDSEIENESIRKYIPYIIQPMEENVEGPNENYGFAEPQYSVVEAPRDQYSPRNNASKATFPGGKVALDSFIVANIRYPESQRALSTKANLTVYFLVNANGTISEISFEHLTTPQEARFIFETDVRRVLNLMPKWIPAKSNNQNIAQYQSVFIQYRAE